MSGRRQRRHQERVRLGLYAGYIHSKACRRAGSLSMSPTSCYVSRQSPQSTAKCVVFLDHPDPCCCCFLHIMLYMHGSEYMPTYCCLCQIWAQLALMATL